MIRRCSPGWSVAEATAAELQAAPVAVDRDTPSTSSAQASDELPARPCAFPGQVRRLSGRRKH